MSMSIAVNATVFALRTGCQWNALNTTGIGFTSSTHCLFQEWQIMGVFKYFGIITV
ncbi:transposase [Xenorhabdus sp. Reich]|uniref:Transposase n=1 Tax=Xenorhabdus littoralis TaxID=2582835 RepID=A0ABU4SLF0_9GAMM|nr:transposase [Xenorhabdus sp. Reich]